MSTTSCLLRLRSLRWPIKEVVSGIAGGLGRRGYRSAPEAGRRLTIAFVPGTTTNPFYITMRTGAQEEADRLGLTLLWQGGDDFTPQTQIPVLLSVLAQNPDALIVAPNHEDAVRAIINLGKSVTYPIFCVDSAALQGTNIFSGSVSSDNRAGAFAAADFIAEHANGRGAVLVQACCPGVTTLDERARYFTARISERYPNIRVLLTQYDNADPDRAQSVTQSILRASPEVVGIFSTGGPTGIGLGRGIAASGKSATVAGVAYDAEPAHVDLLRAGSLKALVAQDAVEEGRLVVRAAHHRLLGLGELTPVNIVLPPVLVTAGQADNPAFSKYFYLPGS